jgi:hypothetical protein
VLSARRLIAQLILLRGQRSHALLQVASTSLIFVERDDRA